MMRLGVFLSGRGEKWGKEKERGERKGVDKGEKRVEGLKIDDPRIIDISTDHRCWRER